MQNNKTNITVMPSHKVNAYLNMHLVQSSRQPCKSLPSLTQLLAKCDLHIFPTMLSQNKIKLMKNTGNYNKENVLV